eukprot:768340-Hanusia_phi.AAC.4
MEASTCRKSAERSPPRRLTWSRGSASLLGVIGTPLLHSFRKSERDIALTWVAHISWDGCV